VTATWQETAKEAGAKAAEITRMASATPDRMESFDRVLLAKTTSFFREPMRTEKALLPSSMTTSSRRSRYDADLYRPLWDCGDAPRYWSAQEYGLIQQSIGLHPASWFAFVFRPAPTLARLSLRCCASIPLRSRVLRCGAGRPRPGARTWQLQHEQPSLSPCRDGASARPSPEFAPEPSFKHQNRKLFVLRKRPSFQQPRFPNPPGGAVGTAGAVDTKVCHPGPTASASPE
jgi:hypothetical protein